jgi:hypothetical protein
MIKRIKNGVLSGKRGSLHGLAQNPARPSHLLQLIDFIRFVREFQSRERGELLVVAIKFLIKFPIKEILSASLPSTKQKWIEQIYEIPTIYHSHFVCFRLIYVLL